MANRLSTKLRNAWNAQFQRWVSRHIPPQQSITLNRRNIFTLPTRNGMLFVLASILIFIAAINYAVSLAFGLAFLMIAVFILSILYAFNNLNQLKLEGLASPPVYCGEAAGFKVLISRMADRRHESLELVFPDGATTHADLVSLDQQEVTVFVPTTRRGEFKAPRLRITTFYPLGLCRAWSVVDLNLQCLVYPKPITFVMNEFNSGSSGNDDAAISKEGSEDFYGLREYVVGDPMRQVAWKNVARGQGMQVKQFVDYVDDRLWLDWDMFYGFSTEERLSRLCYCVLQLSRANKPYGLRIPGITIPPASGVGQRNKILRQLALFEGGA